MKRKLVFLVLLFLITVSSSSGQDSTKSKIYFIRRTGLNSFAEAIDIYIDNKRVCKLANDRFSIHTIKEGDHQFGVRETSGHTTGTLHPVKIQISKGEIYYLAINYGESAISKIQCSPVSESEAKKLLKFCAKKPQCYD
jgi:hypothetical protein